MLTDVPPNLPMGNAHWLGRSMPGADHAFKGGAQVAELIHSFRNALGIATDDEWPGGPPPPRQGAPLPSGAIDTIPPDVGKARFGQRSRGPCKRLSMTDQCASKRWAFLNRIVLLNNF